MSRDIGEILSGAEPAQEEQPSVETVESSPGSEPASQPRDERGKFAPKEAGEPTAPAATQAPVVEKDAPQRTPAPPGVIEERNKRKSAEDRAADLERQLAELRGSVTTLTQQRQAQPPAPPPEPPKKVELWDDPDQWGKGLVTEALTPIRQEFAQTRFEMSLDRAVAKHGEDAVKAAQQWVRDQVRGGKISGEQVKARLSQSRSPVMEMVTWHQNSPEVRETALREQIRAELRAEMGGADVQPAPAAQEQPSTQVMPSNLVGQRNVGTRSGPAWSGPASINDIFDRSRKKA